MSDSLVCDLQSRYLAKCRAKLKEFLDKRDRLEDEGETEKADELPEPLIGLLTQDQITMLKPLVEGNETNTDQASVKARELLEGAQRALPRKRINVQASCLALALSLADLSDDEGTAAQ